MKAQIIFGVIFLLGGVFQVITIFLIAKGNYHYMLKLVNKTGAMIIYGLFAIVLFYLGIHTLFFR